MSRHRLALPLMFCLVLASTHSAVGAEAERFRVKDKLDGQAVELERRTDGTNRYHTVDASGKSITLTPDEYAKLSYDERAGRSSWQRKLNRVLNITSPLGITWVVLGLFGQLMFTGRMLAQWWASERQRRSVVPVAFWWMSLGGASMLMIYFIWRKDIVGIMGQGTGWLIYCRNLVLIYRHSDAPATTVDPPAEPEAGA
jgi:lipid-A-disaccharide synthase-like uncharacterized protein